MPQFSATYTNRSGQTRTLQLQASDLSRARRDLRRRGIIATSLELAATTPNAAAGSTVFGMDLSSLLEAKPGIREKALFANKLAALVDAGVPIVR
ncbi:MAG: type II secretion system F family protein, partial [Vulcanococcus sp.]